LTLTCHIWKPDRPGKLRRNFARKGEIKPASMDIAHNPGRCDLEHEIAKMALKPLAVIIELKLS
jgi:hypothetical protein